MEQLERTFTTELLGQLSAATEVTGVQEARLQEQAEKSGGVQAVKQLLSRNQTTRHFQRLKELGRLELSVEAMVIQGKYSSLFTDDEVNACLDVLLENGYF